jgi:thiamine pyrophosphokinase
MTMRCIVLANGSIQDLETLRSRLAEWQGAVVIAADGGWCHAQELGLQLQTVVGDLDSIAVPTRDALAREGVEIVAHPRQKDETDLELALLHAKARNATHVAVLGALGGRIDMTVSNIMLLIHPQLATLRIEFWAGMQTAWLIRPPGEQIPAQMGDTLSLIPLIEDAQGITTHNLAYALDDESLPLGPGRGVSNQVSGSPAKVSLRRGALLAVHIPQPR